MRISAVRFFRNPARFICRTPANSKTAKLFTNKPHYLTFWEIPTEKYQQLKTQSLTYDFSFPGSNPLL